MGLIRAGAFLVAARRASRMTRGKLAVAHWIASEAVKSWLDCLLRPEIHRGRVHAKRIGSRSDREARAAKKRERKKAKQNRKREESKGEDSRVAS